MDFYGATHNHIVLLYRFLPDITLGSVGWGELLIDLYDLYRVIKYPGRHRGMLLPVDGP
jgi:hypothetical protein